MIPSSTIDFDVIEARKKWSKCGSGKSFVLIHLSCQIELEGRENKSRVQAQSNILKFTRKR
jgi:hypothetical protein